MESFGGKYNGKLFWKLPNCVVYKVPQFTQQISKRKKFGAIKTLSAVDHNNQVKMAKEVRKIIENTIVK